MPPRSQSQWGVAYGGSHAYTVVADSAQRTNVGNYTSIQDAIAAAVLDGASPQSPKVISVEGGDYTEDITIPQGIFLVAIGGPVSARLVDCAIVCDAAYDATYGINAGLSGFSLIGTIALAAPMLTINDLCGMAVSECIFNAYLSGQVAIECLPATVAVLSLQRVIVFGSGAAGAIDGVAINGNVGFSVEDSSLNAFAQTGGAGLSIANAAPGGNQMTCRRTFFSSFAGDCLLCEQVSCTLNVEHCSFNQGGGSADGINLNAATITAIVTHCFFQVNDSGGSRAINGIATVVLWWGGLTFAPAAAGYTNRVATTTIGAGAVNMVVDSITAV